MLKRPTTPQAFQPKPLAATPSQAPTRATAPPMYPSTGQFNTKVVAELAARRQSIFDRARSILKEDYFQRLSLTRESGEAQVEQSFIALRTLWDPELLPPALEEAKNDCSFVMSCLLEAYTTLSNPARRAEYAQSLTTAALRAPAEQLEADLAACGTTDPYEAATGCFARGDLDRAERLARRATKTTPEAGGPLALLAWIEATKPQNASADETKKRIAMLDRAIRADGSLVQAYYWRGLLHKRIESHNAALSSFRKVVELNPKHMDAVREIRVYEMRIRRNSLTMKAVK
jgi:tetratricopeptide (TPR) repeat protein